MILHYDNNLNPKNTKQGWDWNRVGKVGLGAELNLGVFMLNFLLNSVEQ